MLGRIPKSTVTKMSLPAGTPNNDPRNPKFRDVII
jgi:hypothetical protein